MTLFDSSRLNTCFGSTYTKIGTIQRRLAWPLRKDDTQNREAFHIFYVRIILWIMILMQIFRLKVIWCPQISFECFALIMNSSIYGFESHRILFIKTFWYYGNKPPLIIEVYWHRLMSLEKKSHIAPSISVSL